MIGTSTKGRVAFVRQLAWRDWYAHLLWEIPSMVDTSIRTAMTDMAWQNEPADIEAWQKGLTGYPLIDAGMRQLERTGWIHNRVRMVAASFLVKDLLVDWRIGERWFRRLLVDGDIAQNAGNWQWVAGTGTDAAPYFRVFNPVLQSRRVRSGWHLHQDMGARARLHSDQVDPRTVDRPARRDGASGCDARRDVPAPDRRSLLRS